MIRRAAMVLGAAILLSGCVAVTTTELVTDFDPASVPHRVVTEHASGSDGGFALLGFIPLASATRTGALADAWERLGLAPGGSEKVTTARFRRTSSFYLLFSLQTVEVEAAIVELTGPR